MNIVITGSLGNISKPLTEELVGKNHEVTLISSKPEKQSGIEELGAVAAIGSLEDVDFLTATFTGADAVYVMIPPNFAEPDQLAYYRRLGQNYAKAIEQSGIKRVVHLSSYGAHLDKGTGFIVGSHDVEEMLNGLSGVSVTHLRPSYFYYNLLNFAGMIKGQGFIGANYGGDDTIVLVHPIDIATAAAEELTKSTGENVRYVASDDLTASEIARILGVAIGKPELTWITFTNEQMQSGMEQRGMPPHLVANFVDLGASTHSGALREDYDQHRPVMGKVKMTDFAKEFAAVFQNV